MTDRPCAAGATMTVSAFAPVRDPQTAKVGSDSGTPDTFPKLLIKHARVRRGRPANREKDYGIWQSWSWAEVAAEVEAPACGLAASGFRRGDKLAIIGDNRPRPATASRRRLCRERLTDPCRTDR